MARDNDGVSGIDFTGTQIQFSAVCTECEKDLQQSNTPTPGGVVMCVECGKAWKFEPTFEELTDKEIWEMKQQWASFNETVMDQIPDEYESGDIPLDGSSLDLEDYR